MTEHEARGIAEMPQVLHFTTLRDAQRAADAWNRDHAAPQRTYRGRAR